MAAFHSSEVRKVRRCAFCGKGKRQLVPIPRLALACRSEGIRLKAKGDYFDAHCARRAMTQFA